MNRRITIAIPTYRRPEMLHESFRHVLDDPRVGEVVISDDCSPDGSFELVKNRYRGSEKIKVFQNGSNLDCYRNKHAAVSRASNDWVVLLDDDNIIHPSYLDVLYGFKEWDPFTVYCPDFARPHFNYTWLSNVCLGSSNVGYFLRLKAPKGMSNLETALNTSNYFIHRGSFLGAWDGSIDPVTSDTIFHALNWLTKGGRLHIVEGLEYFHRVHDGSHFKNNEKRTGGLAGEIMGKLLKLK